MISLGIAVVFAALQQTPPAPPPAEPPKGDLVLTLSADKESYVVGETVQAEVVLANKGEKEVEVVPLSFQERSVSFDVTFEAGPGKQRQFRYAVLKPDPFLVERLPLPRVTLKPGKSMTSVFRVPVLKPGSQTIVAHYAGKNLKSAAVTVKAGAQADGAERLAAVLDTSEGTIQIDLLPEEAPNNVANFIDLARRGFYDNLLFHRVVKNSWIQTGCPYDNGYGGPGHALKSEAKNQTAVHEPGAVAMSQNLKSDHTGSQFYIVLTRIPSFDKKFTVIGKVAEAGLEAARKIGGVEVDPKTDRPRQDVQLKKVTIVVVK